MQGVAASTACCIAATALLPARLAGACSPPPGDALAQSAPLSRPSDGEALSAYLAARAWLDRDALPAEDSDDALVALPGSSGVCVLLRLDGRLVGVGEAGLDAGLDAGMADDRSRGRMLRAAVGQAVAKALGDTTIAAARRDLGDKVTARLALEIELAGPVRPLIGRTVADAAQRVHPGAEGIALLRAERCFRAFPSRLLATDTAARPDRTITALLLDAGLPAQDLPSFGPEDRVSLGRFDTVRLRGATPVAPPAAITRGGRLVEPFEVTDGFTRAIAAGLASRLAAQVVARDPERPSDGAALLGTLNPTADEYAPPFAGRRDTALAALALSVAGSHAALPEPTRRRATEQSRALVEFLEGGAANGADPGADPGADCMAVDCMTAIAARSHPDHALRARLAARVARHASAQANDPVVASLVACALLATDAEDRVTRASSIVGTLLDAHDARPLVLVDAALPLALLVTDASLEDGVRARLRTLFGEFSARLRSMQVRSGAPEFATLPPDLEGGLLLPGRPGTVPDTQCLPLAAALAIAEPALPDADREARLTSRRLFVRFLAQHTASDPWVGGFRNPSSLRGLVRGSLVGDDCPPAATAAGLLLALAALERGADSAPLRP